MLKRKREREREREGEGEKEWVRKATGICRTYSIPGKTVALVPEFAVQDLPSVELQPRFLRLQ